MVGTAPRPTSSSIAVTSQRLDPVHEAPRYAAAGVPPCIVLDLPAQVAIVHTGPGPDGYATVHQRGVDDAVEVQGVRLPLDGLLGRSRPV